MEEKAISQDQRLAHYSELVRNHSEAILKGDTVPYTFLNGNMYSYLSKDDFLALRFGKDDRDAFLEKYKTTLVYSYGII